jgi:uncharacterized protein (TIGR03067 family)
MNILLWWLAQNTITVVVMIPLVLLACRLHRNRPAVRHALWVVVLLKFLTPPIVTWPLSIEQMRDAIWTSPASVAKVSGTAPRQRPELPVLPGVKDRVRPDRLPSPQESPHADAAPPAVSTIEQTEPAFAPTVPDVQPPSAAMRLAFQLLGGAWLLGGIVCATVQLRRIGRHASIIRRGTVAPEQLIAEVKATAKQLGMRPPRVIIARGILSPFLWCLGCLRLVWPEALASNIEIARSRGVIAHELAHVRRRDHWVAWLELVGGVVWWWNPLFWFVRRRLRETAEMACDALAIATNPGSRREYAETLLELSAGFQSGVPAPVLAVSAGTPSSFEKRLAMILCDRVSEKLSAWGILAAIGFALVALPGWSLGQQNEPMNDQPPAAEERVKTPQKREQEKEPFTASDQEVADLQGEWAAVAMEWDGEKIPLAELISTKFVVKGNEITALARKPNDADYKMSFKLDPGKTPKEIDITYLDGPEKGETGKGIYTLEGSRLQACFAEQGSTSRPKAFATVTGSLFTMLTLEKEGFTAWGKEVGGLQAGLGFFPGQKRAYSHGEKVTLVVRVRNVGKEEVTFQYVSQFLIETPPAVTDGKGKLVPAGLRTLFGVHVPKQVNLAPGKEIELYGELEVRADFGTGKVSVQYGRVFGNSSSGQIKLDPKLSKLGTGKLELEIKSDPPPATEKKAPQKQDKEAFTAWGKEVDGLQAGLGYDAGQKRAYRHGETVGLVLRVRNVSKKEVEFVCCRQYFMEVSPTMTDGQGKPVRLPSNAYLPKPRQEKVSLAPGKEIKLYELKFKLRPPGENGDEDNDAESEDFAGRVFTFYGTGKFQIQYERLIDKPWAGPEPDSTLSQLATGKLELEIKADPPAATENKRAKDDDVHGPLSNEDKQALAKAAAAKAALEAGAEKEAAAKSASGQGKELLAGELPRGLEFLRPYPEFHKFRFGQDETTIRAIAKQLSLRVTGTAQDGFLITRQDGERLRMGMRDGKCSAIQRLRKD